MATVQAYTKEKSDEIYDATVIDGNIVGDDLVLVTRGGSNINAGNVRGATGATGATGPAGADGTAQIVAFHELSSASATFAPDSAIDPQCANVPQVSGHRYEVRVELEVAIANFSGGTAPRWDFWVQRNGSLLKKFARYESNLTGADTRKISGSIFFTATTTGSTDDFVTWADEVVGGAAIARTDTRAYMVIIDWGVP